MMHSPLLRRGGDPLQWPGVVTAISVAQTDPFSVCTGTEDVSTCNSLLLMGVSSTPLQSREEGTSIGSHEVLCARLPAPSAGEEDMIWISPQSKHHFRERKMSAYLSPSTLEILSGSCYCTSCCWDDPIFSEEQWCSPGALLPWLAEDNTCNGFLEFTGLGLGLDKMIQVKWRTAPIPCPTFLAEPQTPTLCCGGFFMFANIHLTFYKWTVLHFNTSVLPGLVLIGSRKYWKSNEIPRPVLLAQ